MCTRGSGLAGQAKMETGPLSPLGLGSTSLFPSLSPLKTQPLPPIDIESGKDFALGLLPSLNLSSSIWYLLHAKAITGPEDTEDRQTWPRWNL